MKGNVPEGREESPKKKLPPDFDSYYDIPQNSEGGSYMEVRVLDAVPFPIDMDSLAKQLRVKEGSGHLEKLAWYPLRIVVLHPC